MLLEIMEASPTEKGRKSRSIWPFSSSELKAEDLISEENKRILKKAGLEKSLDLSSHPLWKIHKYEGIDVKPVNIETEVIKADRPVQAVPSVTPATEAVTPASTATSVDLSFLDDLGGLAAFLPDPKTEEEEASDLIADAIKREEESHPGFFKRLWGKIWGAPAAKVGAIKDKASGIFSSLFSLGQREAEESKEEEEEDDDDDDDDDVLTIYLPETQGSYAAVFLPAKSQESNPRSALFPGDVALTQASQKVEARVPALPALPPNHANELVQPLPGKISFPSRAGDTFITRKSTRRAYLIARVINSFCSMLECARKENKTAAGR
jgi:hypothetical protein